VKESRSGWPPHVSCLKKRSENHYEYSHYSTIRTFLIGTIVLGSCFFSQRGRSPIASMGLYRRSSGITNAIGVYLL